MRFYDKQGNTHLTRIRAMGANISHKLHANNRAHDSGKVGRYVEEGLDKIAVKFRTRREIFHRSRD